MFPKDKNAQLIVQYCKLYKLENIIISPGSRNAPLIIGFTNDPYFKTYSIVDERCAGFFALGMSKKTNMPTVLTCTSGTALLNYYPAICEAYYSNIPLIIISADRPSYLIDKADGQTIRQPGVFSNHLVFQCNLKKDTTLLSKAISCSLEHNKPVHINVPFDKHLYKKTSAEIKEKLILFNSSFSLTSILSKKKKFFKAFNNSKKTLILIGTSDRNPIIEKQLDILSKIDSVFILSEANSNINKSSVHSNIDRVLTFIENNSIQQKKTQPDLLITLGGNIVSKKIKQFLRTHSPKQHFHIGETPAYDTFFCLNKHFKAGLNQLFDATLIKENLSNYKTSWLSIIQKTDKKHDTFLKQTPYCDLLIFHHLYKQLPKSTIIHFSNSSPIRYAQLFKKNKFYNTFANRGTNGIEGSTSTAIGYSILENNCTLLVTGDISFFYDSNALWNNYTPINFKILLINNKGGNIFKFLTNKSDQNKNFSTFFETKHNLKAKKIAELYNYDYLFADNINSFLNNLKLFFKSDTNPVIYEVETDPNINEEVLKAYFTNLI